MCVWNYPRWIVRAVMDDTLYRSKGKQLYLRYLDGLEYNRNQDVSKGHQWIMGES